MRRLLALVVAVLALAPTAAHAHGDEVQLEVVEAIPSDVGSSVTYRVELSYVNDDDPIDGRAVTATAVLRGQPPAEPVTMDGAGQGIYVATISVPSPGAWTVQFDTTAPVATTQATFRVEPPPPTTATAPTTPAAPPTSAVAPEDATLEEEDDDADGPPTFLIVGVVVAGVLMLGAGTALALRRRREAS